MAKLDTTRVLMLVENCSYPRDVRVRREAETLVSAGFAVSVVSQALDGQPRRETIKGVRVYRYKAPPEIAGQFGYIVEYGYSILVTLLLVINIALTAGIDVIHAANPPDLFVFIALLFKPFGVKFVYDQHDLAPEMYGSRYSTKPNRFVETALRLCEGWSYRFADHVVVANASYRENAMLRGRVPAARVSIVRNGPDAAQLDHRVEALEGLFEPGTITIAYLGLMGVQDGVDYLIRALSRLLHDLRRTDFRCLLIGSGEQQKQLEQLVRACDLQPYVRFAGFIPDPDFISYLLAADICVDPDPFSKYNNCSTMIKVMDYMAAGKPIVAFDLLETRRSAGDAALYVEPNDELKFAEALAHLMDHPEQRVAMGALGRSRVEGELSWSTSAEHLLRAYAALTPAHRVQQHSSVEADQRNA